MISHWLMASEIAREVVDHSAKMVHEREGRENNVILFNAKESPSQDALARKQHDKKLFDVMCNQVLGKPLLIENVTRIGKKNDDVNNAAESDTDTDENFKENPRPIKVRFTSVLDKRKFLSSLSNLKDAPTELQNISVTQDLSPDERAKSKQLLKKAYVMNQEEKPADFLYKVRGPPHAMRIVKIFKKH